MILHSKKDFQDLFQQLLNPLKSLYSIEKAGINIGVTAACYDEGSILMETFSRPLWGLVPFWAGGGQDKDFETFYPIGLAAGCNPASQEYWGDFRDYDQKFVEMAAIAYGIMFAPKEVWEPIKDKERVAVWLLKINDYQLPCCNWLLFRVLVNIALKQIGHSYDTHKLEEDLGQIEGFYLGDGWYQDGDSEQKDYYISFAIHFYSLIYAKVMETQDSERSQKFKERATIFAQQFIYWNDEDGSAIPYGRSLTYRFAQISFWGACLLTGIVPFTVAQMKGLIVRHLDSWMKQPIFDRDGILTIGYGYPNLIMAEHYNAPGSPYWSLKTFVVLALPDEHPFWQVESAPMPKRNKKCAMPFADMLVHTYPHHVTAFVPGKYSPNGHGQTTAKYGKFAYDSKFGINVSKSCYELHEAAPDSMLAFVINGYVYVRRICESYQVTEECVISKWIPYPGVSVETTIIPAEEGHTRKHRIYSEIPCVAYDCGFSVAAREEDNYQVVVKDNESAAQNNFSSCRVIGWVQEDIEENDILVNGEIIGADANTNIIYPQTVIPAVQYQIKKGVTEVTTLIVAEVF